MKTVKTRPVFYTSLHVIMKDTMTLQWFCTRRASCILQWGLVKQAMNNAQSPKHLRCPITSSTAEACHVSHVRQCTVVTHGMTLYSSQPVKGLGRSGPTSVRQQQEPEDRPERQNLYVWIWKSAPFLREYLVFAFSAEWYISRRQPISSHSYQTRRPKDSIKQIKGFLLVPSVCNSKCSIPVVCS